MAFAEYAEDQSTFVLEWTEKLQNIFVQNKSFLFVVEPLALYLRGGAKVKTGIRNGSGLSQGLPYSVWVEAVVLNQTGQDEQDSQDEQDGTSANKPMPIAQSCAS